MKPEIGKMLIAGYKYFCRDEIVELAALIELSQGRFDQILKKLNQQKKRRRKRKTNNIEKFNININQMMEII